MYIYVTTNIQNGKQYVGKCHKPVSKSKYYLGSGILLRQSLYNYGKEFFKKQILEENLTLDTINIREQYWINKLATKSPHGYNLTDGGEGLINPSSETREKIGLKNRGINSGRYGKTNTEEHRELIRKLNRERGQSEEAREKIRTFNLGKTLSEKTKTKIQAYQVGRKKSPETKALMKKNNAKSIEIKQLDLNGNHIGTYTSIREAVKETGISYQKLKSCLTGKIDNIQGYQWKELKDK